jgi:electron-transferring-flavoprotein dehydrogenase
MASADGRVIPAAFRPPVDSRQEFIKRELDDEDERIEVGVAIVGGGPAGLACANRLLQLLADEPELTERLGEVPVAVIEKGKACGAHNLSGAMMRPSGLQELFPDLSPSDWPTYGQVDRDAVYWMLGPGRALPLKPTPPPFRNHGNYVVSVAELSRWMAEKAEEAGAYILTETSAHQLLVEDGVVRGIRSGDKGRGRDGEPQSNFEPGADVTARATVLAEGTWGHLTGAAIREFDLAAGREPQVWALGVKEVWEVPSKLDRVVHTLGWPLPTDAFGGSFMYPLEPNLVALGLVVGLDYHDASLDVHVLLQRMKQHPLFRAYLDGGEMVEWGAKTIPEGGYHALPRRRHGDGLLIVGDAAGYVEVASLKGIHYAMQSGIFAARAIFAALKRGDTSAAALAPYDQAVNDSFIVKDLYQRRNMRLVFQKHGFYRGGVQAALMTLTGGAFPGGHIETVADAEVPRVARPAPPFTPDGKLTFAKVDAVFKSGNATRDDIPSHLVVAPDTPPEAAELFHHMCPAAVYERQSEGLGVNPPNCIDCKATDVLGPRWTPREGGSGPRYRRM